jgi:chromosomal replication initiation ATPase DnaA
MQIKDLLNSVCRLYDTTTDKITSVEKTQKTVIPRIIFANVAKECGWTYKEIGAAIKRTPGMVAYYVNSKRKDTILYKRGYNSLKNIVTNESEQSRNIEA